jgi:uncharacterized protein (TIGR01615 family)
VVLLSLLRTHKKLSVMRRGPRVATSLLAPLHEVSCGSVEQDVMFEMDENLEQEASVESLGTGEACGTKARLAGGVNRSAVSPRRASAAILAKALATPHGAHEQKLREAVAMAAANTTVCPAELAERLQHLGYVAHVCSSRPHDDAAKRACEAGMRGSAEATTRQLSPPGSCDSVRVAASAPWSENQLGEHLIVALNIRDAFTMPRPSEDYASLLDAIPEIFVGSPEQLCLFTDWMQQRMHRAYACAGMPLPPWRSAEAMRRRWGLPRHCESDGIASDSAS